MLRRESPPRWSYSLIPPIWSVATLTGQGGILGEEPQPGLSDAGKQGCVASIHPSSAEPDAARKEKLARGYLHNVLCIKLCIPEQNQTAINAQSFNLQVQNDLNLNKDTVEIFWCLRTPWTFLAPFFQQLSLRNLVENSVPWQGCLLGSGKHLWTTSNFFVHQMTIYKCTLQSNFALPSFWSSIV
jgi:hypothetical protein